MAQICSFAHCTTQRSLKDLGLSYISSPLRSVRQSLVHHSCTPTTLNSILMAACQNVVCHDSQPTFSVLGCGQPRDSELQGAQAEPVELKVTSTVVYIHTGCC
jgi:hypothetical protein